MHKRLLLLLNPCAGQKKANRLMPEIIRTFNDRDYDCVTYVTSCNGDAVRYMRERGAGYDHIVCIGGDGTLNETIAGMIEGGVDCPVGYIAAGTTNDYASSLGLSADILTAAADAVDGVPCRFDLGSFNGRQFIYTASCGAFARASLHHLADGQEPAGPSGVHIRGHEGSARHQAHPHAHRVRGAGRRGRLHLLRGHQFALRGRHTQARPGDGALERRHVRGDAGEVSPRCRSIGRRYCWRCAPATCPAR